VAYALARYWGSATFTEWMNDKARAIGMSDTALEEPSGISPRNVSTANDVFRLARYIHDSQSFILTMSREQKKTITAESGRRYALGNLNIFAGEEGFLGGKTGYTDEAEQTMVAVFEVPFEESTATIAVVVLGSDERKSDIEKLRSWFRSAAKIAMAETTEW
jgi:D-alanyl-D-alanine endopeptidase (penicillin-binding protein 7)